MARKSSDRRPPFSLEVKIMDEDGKKIFHWKPAHHNLAAGIERMNEFLRSKLGVDMKVDGGGDDKMEEYIKRWFGDYRKK